MKRFKNILTCLVSVLCVSVITLFSFAFSPTDSVNAEVESDVRNKIYNQLLEFIEYGSTQKTRQSRIPGSKAEYNSAMYIHSEMLDLNNFKPVNNASTENGIENFEFTSVYDGNTYTSQNIIFRRESFIETDRKIIIATHYDTSYVNNNDTYASGNGLVKDGINDNAASVAVLLTLAKSLDEMSLDYGFDIEIVLFGASSNNYNGSAYYSRGQSEADEKNTLLMINLDKIAMGSYNYAYVNEFKTTQEEYIFSLLNGFKKLKNKNVLDFNKESPNGLSYTHIGLESDHANFMARNINVVSFFSGSYENAITYGINEYNDGKNVTYTENDSYLYILNNLTGVLKNLTNVYFAVDTIISDNNFIAQMEKPNNLAEKYDFWTNEKLAVFITAIIFVVFILIYVLIYGQLKKKSRAVTGGVDIDKIVIKITKNLDASEDKMLSDAIDKKIKDDTDNEEEEK